MGPNLCRRARPIGARLYASACDLIAEWVNGRPGAKHHLSLVLAGGAVAVAVVVLTLARGGTGDGKGVAWASTQQPLSPTLIPFTLQDRGMTIHLTAYAATVGEALDDLDIALGDADLVNPSRDTPLTPGLRVVVRRAKHIFLDVDGSQRWVTTHAANVADLLMQQNVAVHPLDKVLPGASAAVSDGMYVKVVRVQVLRDVQEETIPRPVVYRDDPSVLRGRTYVAQEGADGLVRREYEVTYEDGRETARRLLSETTLPPQEQVVVRGTGSPPPPPAAVGAPPSGDCSGISYRRTMTVYATWYAPGRGAGYYTATGARVGYGIVAVDPRVIPLGTRMCVPGYGMAVAADTGGGVRGYMIDLAYPEGVVPNWRTGYVTIYILD